jgi:hypothetical protein
MEMELAQNPNQITGEGLYSTTAAMIRLVFWNGARCDMEGIGLRLLETATFWCPMHPQP